MAAVVTTDEIYKRYLDKAIREINRLRPRDRGGGRRGVAVAADGPPARDDLPAQVRPAGAGAPGGRRLPRPRRPRADQVAAAPARRPERGLRHELRQVRRRRGGRRRAAWLARELRIVQPKLLVVMGDDALAVRERRSRSRSRARSRRRSGELQHFTPTIEALVVPGHRRLARRAAGEDRLLERLQAASAPGGPPCRRTSGSRAALVAWYALAPTTAGRRRCGGTSRGSRSSLIPAVVRARLARAPALARARPPAGSAIALGLLAFACRPRRASTIAAELLRSSPR